MGLVSAAGLVGSHQAQRLTAWARTAEADLTLVEALQGFPLDPAETLANALPGIFVNVSGCIFLSRYSLTAETVANALPGIFVTVSGCTILSRYSLPVQLVEHSHQHFLLAPEADA